MVSAVPFGEMGIVTVVISSALVGLIMSTFMSNTATANLLLPIMSALGVSLMSGGDSKVGMMLILALTFACSLAMAMPISTPPNALAHATGQINTGDMAKSGIVIGLLGLAGAFVLVYILKTIGFFAM
jgi:sodium-dependent dicarboxylate transporter 2/3/5